MSPAPGSHHGGHRRLRFLPILSAVLLVVVAWALATPPGSGPDEPAQVIRAASLVRGELLGAPVGRDSPTTRVQVPSWLARVDLFPCYAGRPGRTARCARPLATTPGTGSATTYVGRYPPLYYAVTGWPSLLLRGNLAWYLMRVSEAAVCALFLTGALWCADRSMRRPGLLLGLALGLTPQVFFLASVVNPSGLEISTAICAWTACTVLVTGTGSGPDWPVVAWLLASAAVMANTRGLSPLFLVFLAAALVGLGGWRAARHLFRAPAARAGLAMAVAAAVVAVIWVVGAGALRVVPSSTGLPAGAGPVRVLVLVATNVLSFAPQFVGAFGWFDTFLPLPVYVLWLGALTTLVVASAVRSRTRRRIVLAALVAACFLVPTLVTFVRAHQIGIFGQARDWMPLWVGLPILAGALLSERRAGQSPATVPPTRATVTVVGTFAAAVQLLAWWLDLHRYRSGLDHGLVGGLVRWSPPVPADLLAVAMMAGVAGLIWCCRASVVAPKALSPPDGVVLPRAELSSAGAVPSRPTPSRPVPSPSGPCDSGRGETAS